MPKIISRAEAREQGLKHYFTGKPCKRGHKIRNTNTGHCPKCKEISDLNYEKSLKGKQKKLEYRKNNSDKFNEWSRKWYQEKGKEQQSKYRKDERAKYPDKVKERNVKWLKSEKGKEFLNRPYFKIHRALSQYLRASLKNNKTIKSFKTFSYVGLNRNDFLNYIKKKFYKNPITNEKMNMENYGKGGWEIDHIIPVSYFFKNYDYQNLNIQKICWHYSNLQPLWKTDNTKKSNKISKQVAEKKIAKIKKLINA